MGKFKNDLPNLFDWTKETFLPEDFDLNTWAHGACGIGTAKSCSIQNNC